MGGAGRAEGVMRIVRLTYSSPLFICGIDAARVCSSIFT